MKPNDPQIGRRSFIKNATGAAAGMMVFPHIMTGSDSIPPSEKLNLAFVGVGGKGVSSIMPLAEHNIIGLCDVDERRVAQARQQSGGQAFADVIDGAVSKGGKWFKDYRVMFEELGEKLDGVVISIPDHMHFPVAMSAVNLGINVYCEKPLTHTVEEARMLAKAARKKGVVSQMGNQGHSNEGVRLAKEWIAAGVIGQVREAYSWTNRPIWPQGLKKPDHSQYIPVVPKGLDWKLWSGVAEKRAYDPAYLPFSWRAWWDYGCGAVGDMACHVMDAAYYSLDLGLPTSIEALATEVNDYCAPNASAITYKFPKRGKFDAVTYHWLDGGLLPPAPKGFTHDDILSSDKSGSLFIGEEGFMVTDTYTRSVRILPASRFMDFRQNLPPKTIPRVKGSHQSDWVRAIKEKGEACSHFDYAAGLTEVGILGNVAIRSRARIEYDAAQMRVTNMPEANDLLKKEYPKGWILS